jgi:hypothetical protein
MQALWTLQGVGVVLFRDWKSLLALVFYTESPVGPYNEFAVIQRQGGAPSVTEILVDSEAARQAGRELWGFPKELADLEWQSGGSSIVFRKEREYFRVRAIGFSLPFRVRWWTKQMLHEKRVRVPFSISGRVGLGLRGKQWALVLEEFEMHVFAPC